MATRQSIVDYLLGQLADVEGVSARKMFGEYALYCGGKVVALICDDQLFVKPTKSAKEFIGEVEEARPYRNGRLHYLVSGDRWDDGEWLTQLIRLIAADLAQR